LKKSDFLGLKFSFPGPGSANLHIPLSIINPNHSISPPTVCKRIYCVVGLLKKTPILTPGFAHSCEEGIERQNGHFS
jgi:hypothetical protein